MVIDHSDRRQYNQVMKQIALPLYETDDFSFSDIVLHLGISNSIKMLQGTFQNPANESIRVLTHGPSGSGKTLVLKALLNYFRNREFGNTGECVLISADDQEAEGNNLESIVAMNHEDMSRYAAVLIDDVDRISASDSNHLWNLWNQLLTTGAHLVCASSVGPDHIFSDNPHLRSRMISGLSLELSPPDDASRVLILDRMATKRGLRLTHDVISYLLSRKSRNLNRLEEILGILDRISLEDRRRVTLRLIKDLEAEGLL